MPQPVYSTKQDLDRIARCHISAFSNSLASKLGVNYVKRMLEWYLVHPKAILIHLEQKDDDAILGYAALVINDVAIAGSTTGMYQFSKKQLLKSILLRPWLLFHIDFIKRIKFFLRKLGISLRVIKPRPNIPEDFKPSLGIVIIGVSKSHQGKGFGQLLLEKIDMVAFEHGFNRLSLSVKMDNLQAIGSYEKNGWIISKIESTSGEMVKYLAKSR